MLSIPDILMIVEAFDPGDDPAAEASRRQTLELLSRSPFPLSRTNVHPGHLTGSAVVLSPDRQRVLLVFHHRLQRWLQPGGHVEPSDTDIMATARREVFEETGITGRVDHVPVLVGVDVHRIPVFEREPSHLHHDLVFRVIAEAEDFRLSAEAPKVAWCPVDDLRPYGLDPFITKAIRRACIENLSSHSSQPHHAGD